MDHSKNKTGLFWTTDQTAHWLRTNLLVHRGTIENSRREGSLLSDPSVNWTVPHTGLGSAAEVSKEGLKKKTPENKLYIFFKCGRANWHL